MEQKAKRVGKFNIIDIIAVILIVAVVTCWLNGWSKQATFFSRKRRSQDKKTIPLACELHAPARGIVV